MWLRNCWYVIAWDHEIPLAASHELFSRTVLGEPVLVYRSADGAFVALEDRCCPTTSRATTRTGATGPATCTTTHPTC